MERQRKIIHVDMDAFYASVEQRDDDTLRGQPVIVAWRGARSVVCAASYEARKFGVHSAMPAVRAERLCPRGIFVPPDFLRYKAASREIHTIFAHYTDVVEPLSLDEAYLDVTDTDAISATAVAEAIRADILAATRLTASAGVAPNKFLAKIASDWNKPDGLTVVRPSQVDPFLLPLPVGKIPGVGKVTQARLAALGIRTVGDLRGPSRAVLDHEFGRWGARLFDLARGIDDRAVQAHRETVQISSEDTFEHDLTLAELEPHIRRLAEKTWAAQERKTGRVARTLTLKLKTADFRIMTRSLTPTSRPTNAQELAELACALRQRVEGAPNALYRLVGVGLSGFIEQADSVRQPDLFEGSEVR